MKTRNWDSDKNGNSILDDGWMTHRFDLFENYCFPSVKAQSNQSFKWIVLFNSDTDEKWRNKISELESQYDLFQPLFIDGVANMLSDLKSFISGQLSEDKYVVTTRMDNDDLIHKDFIDAIQTLAKPVDKLVVDLRRGYQVNFLNGEVKSYYAKFNPFISVVEHVKTMETVFARIHGDWRTETNLRVGKSDAYWVQVVHDRNKYIYDKEGLFYASNPKLSEFQMDFQVNNPKWLVRIFLNFMIYLKNKFT